jgi:hypothetical protein
MELREDRGHLSGKVGHFYFGDLPLKVGQHSTGVDSFSLNDTKTSDKALASVSFCGATRLFELLRGDNGAALWPLGAGISPRFCGEYETSARILQMWLSSRKEARFEPLEVHRLQNEKIV